MASVSDQQPEEPRPDDPAPSYPTQPLPVEQDPAQQYPVQQYPPRQYPVQQYPPHSWPAYPPPKKPETSLRAPLFWTAGFSFFGVVAIVGAIFLLVMALLSLVFVLFAGLGAEGTPDPGSFLGAAFGSLVGAALVVVLVGSVLSFLACAGVLMLLRLISDIRRWPSPLQALLACALTYVGGGTIVWILAQIFSATGN